MLSITGHAATNPEPADQGAASPHRDRTIRRASARSATTTRQWHTLARAAIAIAAVLTFAGVATTVASANPIGYPNDNHPGFQQLGTSHAYVLLANRNLYYESAPFGPGHRVQVDGNVQGFQALDSADAFVLGTDGNLWLEFGPWGPIPPNRVLVAHGAVPVTAFQAINASTVYVAFRGTLELITNAGTPTEKAVVVDNQVAAFQGLSATQAYVLGLDGNLWLESAPFGTPPPNRVQVDGHVYSFQALNATHAYVIGGNHNLWLESAPWGIVPPHRVQIATGAFTVQGLSNTTAYYTTSGTLFFTSNTGVSSLPVDRNVAGYQAVGATRAYVLGTNQNLWLEAAPWGTPPPQRVLVDSNVL